MNRSHRLIDKLQIEQNLLHEEFTYLIANRNGEIAEYLHSKAREIVKNHYGNQVFIRGLIEISNYCKNDCLYCGIRHSNRDASRYHLSQDEILQCCTEGYKNGFRTFVLQGGEDLSYTDESIVEIVKEIKNKFPNCAVTLSIGEKEYSTYLSYFQAGADRYLLRHETATAEHYSQLHPSKMSFENRRRCLSDLKRIGYQTGTGFMVGSPYQTLDNIANDLQYIHELDPQMVGIGPFISHSQTPFAHFQNGTMELTLFMIGILRLMLPKALLPATTALGSIDVEGRKRGILAGANVIMPNLSPISVRKKYMIYDNKIISKSETGEYLNQLKDEMLSIGYQIVESRGDYIDF